jgi:carbon monoxide dehydrogenase subunit G
MRVEIAAERLVAAPPPAVFAFLADLQRHWELLPDALDVLAADGSGALIRLHGPLGLRRELRTEVTEVRAPSGLVGVASGTRERATVSWSLTPDGAGTRVRLHVDVERASLRDRALLALGGRAWLRRRLAAALERLDAAVEPVAARAAA